MKNNTFARFVLFVLFVLLLVSLSACDLKVTTFITDNNCSQGEINAPVINGCGVKQVSSFADTTCKLAGGTRMPDGTCQ